jgi:exopolysaccharide production protein ExoY
MPIMSDIAGGGGDFGVARLQPVGGITKRLIDVVLASIGIVMLPPLFSLCVLGILLTSRGAILFRHRRVGFRGRHFDCLKFRTMAPDAGERLSEYLGGNPRATKEWTETHKLKCDPRVTPFGAVLRKTSLDELPQLFNVLRGDMSIVGPRPVTDEELEKYGLQVPAYLACKPGITGLCQVGGRSKTSYRERVMLNYTYAKNWSLVLDAKTMLLTLPVFLGSDDAY